MQESQGMFLRDNQTPLPSGSNTAQLWCGSGCTFHTSAGKVGAWSQTKLCAGIFGGSVYVAAFVEKS